MRINPCAAPSLALLLCCSLATLIPSALGQGTYPPAYPPPPPLVGVPICTQPDGQCLQVEQSNITFPHVSFSVRAVGFELSGLSDDQLEYTFGFLSVENSTAEVPDAAQPLLNTNTTRLIVSPKGPSPNRTLVAPGPGMYEAYVCAHNSLGDQECSSATVMVLAPCPTNLMGMGVGVVNDLGIESKLEAAVARNDTHGVLEATFTLAAVRNALAQESAASLLKLLTNDDFLELVNSALAALNEVLMYEDTDASTGAAVINAQRALLGRIAPISEMAQTAECDLKTVCARGPGFWANHPNIWDADSSNDGTFSGKANYPASDILLPPYYANASDVGLIIGDFDRDGLIGSNETTLTLTLQEAMDALSPGVC